MSDGDTFRCGSCGETRWAGSVSWWTDCENCGASDWQQAATDGGQPDGAVEHSESGGVLSELEYGNTIRVSVRETPMEVKKVKETDDLIQTEHEIIAKNQQGRCRIREDNNGYLSFSVPSPSYCGSSWDTTERNIEVEKIE